MEIVTLIFYQLFGKNAQLNAKVIFRVILSKKPSFYRKLSSNRKYNIFNSVFIYELVDLFFTERSNIKKREIIAIRPIRKKNQLDHFLEVSVADPDPFGSF